MLHRDGRISRGAGQRAAAVGTLVQMHRGLLNTNTVAEARSRQQKGEIKQ